MTPDDLFIFGQGSDAWGSRERRVDPDMLTRIHDGTQAARDVDAALALAEQVQDDLLAEGTSGSPALDSTEIAAAIRALKRVSARIGIDFSLPFRDYATFRRYWVANGAHGSWQARRDMVHELMDSLIDRLNDMRDGLPMATVPEVALNALPNAAAIHEHLKRLGTHIDSDPRLAVSVAKDLVESTAKLVLSEVGETYTKTDDLPALASKAQKSVGLHVSGLRAEAQESADALKKILGSLSGLIAGVAELRNGVGVGHGRESVPEWIRPRHARLAAGAATTWCSLVLETLGDPDAPWQARVDVTERTGS